jgi:hypothetical protein
MSISACRDRNRSFYVHGMRKRGCSLFYRYTAPIRFGMKPSSRISTSFSRAGVIERTVATSEQT